MLIKSEAIHGPGPTAQVLIHPPHKLVSQEKGSAISKEKKKRALVILGNSPFLKRCPAAAEGFSPLQLWLGGPWEVIQVHKSSFT